MIPARQASRRASPGESRAPVSRDAAARPPRRDSRVMVTTTVAHTPPALPTEAAGRVSTYSQNASPSRCLVCCSRPAGLGGVGEEVLAEHLAVQGRDGEPAVAAAVAVLDHRERRGRAGGVFLGLQQPGLVGLADLGGDHVQDPPAQHPQPLRVVVGRVSHEHRLGLATRVGSARSVGRASTASTITAAWSTNTAPEASAARTGSWPSANRPASRVSRCASARVTLAWWDHQVAVEVAPWSRPTSTEVACRATRSSSSVTWARSRVSSSSVAAASVPGHRPQRHPGQVVQVRPRGGDEPRDPMPRIGTQHAFGHDPSQAPATDTPRRSEPLLHKGNLIAAWASRPSTPASPRGPRRSARRRARRS